MKKGVPMQLEDMILVSINGHFIEPPDMYKNHVPAKYLDMAPKVVRNADGVDEWVFQRSARADRTRCRPERSDRGQVEL